MQMDTPHVRIWNSLKPAAMTRCFKQSMCQTFLLRFLKVQELVRTGIICPLWNFKTEEEEKRSIGENRLIV